MMLSHSLYPYSTWGTSMTWKYINGLNSGGVTVDVSVYMLKQSQKGFIGTRSHFLQSLLPSLNEHKYQ